MTNKNSMLVVAGIRYRFEDALRLGLVSKGTVLTANSRKVPGRTDAPPGLITTVVASVAPQDPPPDTPVEDVADTSERPGKSGTKAAWHAFALANGMTEADLDGLKRDDIAALFPAE